MQFGRHVKLKKKEHLHNLLVLVLVRRQRRGKLLHPAIVPCRIHGAIFPEARHLQLSPRLMVMRSELWRSAMAMAGQTREMELIETCGDESEREGEMVMRE